MNKPSTFQIVIEHFKRNRWNFQVDENRPLVFAGFRGNNGTFRCVAVVDETDDFVQIVSFVPLIVPAQKLTVVAHLCVTLSYHMKMAHFKLNEQSGEVLLHTCAVY